jgi:hypothetical protein
MEIHAYEIQAYGDAGLWRCMPMRCRPMEMQAHKTQAYGDVGLCVKEPV